MLDAVLRRAGAVLEIDLGAIRENYRILRAKARGGCAAVVKADAYGLGATVVAPALHAEGARSFFVAHLDEALALQPALPVGTQILVLNGLPPGAEADCAAAGIVPVLNSLGQVDAWAAFARLKGRTLPAAIQVDSGMSRMGLPEHDLARPGAALYGIAPVAGEANPMKPVVRLRGRIVQVRDIPAGAHVGYGASWCAAQPNRIATVSVGYADGYLRSLSHRAGAHVGGTAVPLVGIVSMDSITFDVTDAPDARAGGFVDLIGPENPVDAAAEAGGTIGYGILTSLGSYSPLILKEHGIDLPVYPVKGYSLTVPITEPSGAPESTVMDEKHKVAITRLGDRIRVGGMAELDGYSTDLHPNRRATLEHVVSDLYPAGGDAKAGTFWARHRPDDPRRPARDRSDEVPEPLAQHRPRHPRLDDDLRLGRRTRRSRLRPHPGNRRPRTRHRALRRGRQGPQQRLEGSPRMTPINASGAPAAIGPYCHAVKVGDLLFTSGQIPLDLAGAMPEGVEAQTDQVFDNLAAALKETGASLDQVVKATVFVTDLGDFAKLNAVYERRFGAHKPARSTVQVAPCRAAPRSKSNSSCNCATPEPKLNPVPQATAMEERG